MTAKELIMQLHSMPQDSEVTFFYDGAARGQVEVVCYSIEKEVVLLDADDYNDHYDEIIKGVNNK